MRNNAVTPISVKIEIDIKARLEKLGESRDRTMNWLYAEAIKTYVEQEERRENLKNQSLKAWQNYQESGLHLTAKEAKNWFSDLKNGNYKEPPKCHV